MPNKEILCVTALLNDELLCVQFDNCDNVFTIARDEQHMLELLQEINKLVPIDFNKIQLSTHPESAILEFVQNTEEVDGAVLMTNGKMALVSRDKILGLGIGSFLYYQTDAQPTFYATGPAEHDKEHFFIAFDGDNLFTVTFGGFDHLFLLARTENDMSELASFVYDDSPFNFDNVPELTCEHLHESKIIESIKNTDIDGILFINDKHETVAVLTDSVIEVGLNACFTNDI